MCGYYFIDGHPSGYLANAKVMRATFETVIKIPGRKFRNKQPGSQFGLLRVTVAVVDHRGGNLTRMMPSAQPVMITFLGSHSWRCVKATHRMSGSGPEEEWLHDSS